MSRWGAHYGTARTIRVNGGKSALWDKLLSPPLPAVRGEGGHTHAL
jgi:hypothetical protein